jgi:hypothetical protein
MKLKGNYHKKYRRQRGYRTQREGHPKLICPVCEKPINVISTAIIHKETNKKAHFDCIVRELKKYYHLKPNEGICYLGGGGFGIIETLKSERPQRFVIKRRIQYENR